MFIKLKCLSLEWKGLGQEIYCYSNKTALLSESYFKDHKTDYLDVVIEKTKAYPLVIQKSIANMLTMTLIASKVNSSTVSDDIFILPELEKADKETTKFMSNLGYEVMKIKSK